MHQPGLFDVPKHPNPAALERLQLRPPSVPVKTSHLILLKCHPLQRNNKTTWVWLSGISPVKEHHHRMGKQHGNRSVQPIDNSKEQQKQQFTWDINKTGMIRIELRFRAAKFLKLSKLKTFYGNSRKYMGINGT